MKYAAAILPALTVLPSVHAWGALGHDTVGYIATNFVSASTKKYCQDLLGDTSTDYLASVATWADSYRYTDAGEFSAPYHYIDANDHPPSTCGVDYDRDCGDGGCVVRAINNYTSIVQDEDKASALRVQALKFIVHFLGDIHQPLHDEALEVGGNDIDVTFAGDKTWNLHSVWDSAMLGKLAGTANLTNAKKLATTLTTEIKTGSYASLTKGWLADMDLDDPVTSAMAWATDANSYVCSTVIPDGVDAVENIDLADDYYTANIPVVEKLLAAAGYRLAAWLNLIATGSTGL
ncbi:MAG: hypothetical protein MMC23_005733 [Stictis urceolatum]|nr:hypothetical protein [Stictis urceolata]